MADPVKCDHCLTFAGRTTKGKACCELRALAAMPNAQRQAVYDKVRREDGKEAAVALSKAAAAEYQRKVLFDKTRWAQNDKAPGLFVS